MDLLYFAFQFYLNLRLASFVSHFFKFNANLVMFTTINIYETIRTSYYKNLYLHWNDCNDQVCALPYSAALKLTRGNF